MNFLMAEFSDLAAEAQWSGAQAVTVYIDATDSAWRQMGVAEADLPAAVLDDSNIPAIRALVSFYTLRRLWRAFSLRVDVEIVGQVKAARSQLTKAVQQMLQAAQVEASGYGFYVGGDSFQMGRVTLDFLEPAGAEFDGTAIGF